MNLAEAAGVDLAHHELVRLAVVASGLGRTEVLHMDGFDDAAAERFRDLCRRRAAGEPLQYLEGSVPFGEVEVAVDPRVLIPRPETEFLWELAVGMVDAPAIVVDLCTGSGALALALAHRFPAASVFGTDVSADAIDVAVANAQRLELDVDFRGGDLWTALPVDIEGAVELLVTNPPYVATDDLDTLAVEVRDHEPHVALFAGADGLDIVRRIAADLDRWLAPEGLAIVEIGAGQGADAADLFAASFDVEVRTDLVGRDRYVVVRR